MNVTLCSIFRNAESYLDRYFEQVEHLRTCLLTKGHLLDCIWGEGDSTDGTLDALLFGSSIRATVVNVAHGGPEVGSIVDMQRFKQLSYACNLVWAQIPEDSDIVIWCESDLIWDAATMLELIKDLHFYDCVAPMIMEISTGGFYDVWAFRRNGQHFTKQAPYYPTLPHYGLMEMNSVGSCVAMDARIARQVNFPPDDVIVGMCRAVRSLGSNIYLDGSLKVFHG